MARPCSVCVHSKREEIDRCLVEGATFRTIADRSGLSQTALKRHKKDHLPVSLTKAAEVEEVADAGSLLSQVEMLRDRSLSILDTAEQAGDLRTALQGIREARACIELLLEVEGELDRRNVVSVTINPQWVEIRGFLLDTLAAYPDAAQAVSAGLLVLEGGRDAS